MSQKCNICNQVKDISEFVCGTDITPSCKSCMKKKCRTCRQMMPFTEFTLGIRLFVNCVACRKKQLMRKKDNSSSSSRVNALDLTAAMQDVDEELENTHRYVEPEATWAPSIDMFIQDELTYYEHISESDAPYLIENYYESYSDVDVELFEETIISYYCDPKLEPIINSILSL